MSEKKSRTAPAEVSFEDALKRLEEIVRQMESGDLPLERMVGAYEEGRKLLDLCGAKLNEVEKKIELLEKNGPSGEWTARPLDAAPAGDPPKERTHES